MAFFYELGNDSPVDGEELYKGASRIREAKGAVIERLLSVFSSLEADPLPFLPNIIDGFALKDGSVTANKLASGSTTPGTGGITTGMIADDAITAAKIAANAVGTLEIADAAVGTGELADEAVTAPKIAPASVTTTKVADGAITTPKLGFLPLQIIVDGSFSAFTYPLTVPASSYLEFANIADARIQATDQVIFNPIMTPDNAAGELLFLSVVYNGGVRIGAWNRTGAGVAKTAVNLRYLILRVA